MEIIDKDEFESRKEEIVERIRAGHVFIYGTDTIYGIGCDATNDKAVKKIRKVKQRKDAPFSVIAPSKEWITENCTGFGIEKELGKLPGPYTLILKLKKKECVSKFVNPGNHTLGVRIPDHWFSEFVNEIGKPIVTTSVNKAGEPYLETVEDIEPEIEAHVDFVLNEGKIAGNPSAIIDLTSEKKKIIER